MRSTVPLALALRDPRVEAAARRAQVIPQLLVERADLVAEAEHDVVEPACLVADVVLALVPRHGGAALLARHVARLEERRHRRRLHGTYSVGRNPSSTERAAPRRPSVSSPQRRRYLRAGSRTAPNWTSIPSVSQFVHSSTTLPSRKREIVMPLTVASLPVGGMPISSPSWIPRPVQRVATRSPSASCASAVTRASRNAVRYVVTNSLNPAGPRSGSGFDGS